MVAMKNTLYPNEGLQRARTGIVTGPFAKGTFFSQLARSHFTFQDDLRIGGIRQPGDVTADHFGGCSSQTAGEVELAHSCGYRARGGEPIEGIAAENHIDGASADAFQNIFLYG